jgi:tetratricopeptide (TPR) repeat protein
LDAELRAGTLAAIATAQAKAGLAHDARVTFADAIRTASSIEHAENAARAMIGIALAQGKAGLPPENQGTTLAYALEAAGKIWYAEHRDKTLTEIVAAQAKASLYGDALGTARQIEDALRRVMALTQIAVVQAKAGLRHDAQETFEHATSITDGMAKSGTRAEDCHQYVLPSTVEEWVASRRAEIDAWASIGAGEAETGFIREAQSSFRAAAATARPYCAELSVSYSLSWLSWHSRTTPLHSIATLQTRAGLYVDAVETTESVEDLEAIATAQVDAGLGQAAKFALDSARKGARGSPIALVRIAALQTKAGLVQDAQATLSAAAGLKTLSEEPLTYFGVSVLVTIAKAQAKAGFIQDAQATFDKAIEMEELLGSNRFRIDAFAEIAARQAKATMAKSGRAAASSDKSNSAGVDGVRKADLAAERAGWEKSLSALLGRYGVTLDGGQYARLWSAHFFCRGWRLAPAGASDGDVLHTIVAGEMGSRINQDIPVVKGIDGGLWIRSETKESDGGMQTVASHMMKNPDAVVAALGSGLLCIEPVRGNAR